LPRSLPARAAGAALALLLAATPGCLCPRFSGLPIGPSTPTYGGIASLTAHEAVWGAEGIHDLWVAGDGRPQLGKKVLAVGAAVGLGTVVLPLSAAVDAVLLGLSVGTVFPLLFFLQDTWQGR
jgi:hypothetical protein